MSEVTVWFWNPELHRPGILRMGQRFIRESRTGAFMGPDASLAQLEATMRSVEAHGTVFIATTARGDVIGFLALLLVTNPFTLEVHAEDAGFWVEPEHRRTRGAPQLLAAAENWARQVGAAVLKMTAPPWSGFHRWLERDGYVTAEVAMVKPLTKDARARIQSRVRDRRERASAGRAHRARPRPADPRDQRGDPEAEG